MCKPIIAPSCTTCAHRHAKLADNSGHCQKCNDNGNGEKPFPGWEPKK